MAGTIPRRLASLTFAVLLVVALSLSAGCQKQVISEKSYSATQFSEFSHLPRADWRQPKAEPGLLEKAGDGIGNGIKGLFRAIGKLNPFGD